MNMGINIGAAPASCRPLLFVFPPPKNRDGNERQGQRAATRGTPRVGRVLGVPTQLERTLRVQATTHAERARSEVGAKMGSSSVVDTHKTRDKVGFGMAFGRRGDRTPRVFGHAARFARVEGEVRKNSKAKDFLEGWRGGQMRNANAGIGYIRECLAHPTRPRTIVHPSPL